VPQAKEPGAEAEVDFGPVSIVVGDDQAACHLFAYRLSYSGKAVHRPIDRTNGPFFVDPPRAGRLTGQASSSLITRRRQGGSGRGDQAAPLAGAGCCPGRGGVPDR
jgi:hypothetical protein